MVPRGDIAAEVECELEHFASAGSSLVERLLLLLAMNDDTQSAQPFAAAAAVEHKSVLGMISVVLRSCMVR